MKKSILIVLILASLLSCTSDKKELTFFYENTFCCTFSVVFNDSDTLYMKSYFSARETIAEGKSYYTLLTQSEKERFREFFLTMEQSTIDSVYYESYKDGSSYGILIKNDTVTRRYYMHSKQSPKSTNRFSEYVYTLYHNKKFSLYEKNITTDRNLERKFNPPIPPVPNSN